MGDPFDQWADPLTVPGVQILSRGAEWSLLLVGERCHYFRSQSYQVVLGNATWDGIQFQSSSARGHGRGGRLLHGLWNTHFYFPVLLLDARWDILEILIHLNTRFDVLEGPTYKTLRIILALSDVLKSFQIISFIVPRCPNTRLYFRGFQKILHL